MSKLPIEPVARVTHKLVREGHQILMLILIEGARLKFIWLGVFCVGIVAIVALQCFWPEAKAAEIGAVAEVREDI